MAEQKMTLGSYTFQFNPHQFTEPQKNKSYSIVETITSAVFYSWGSYIEGEQVVLEWESMPETMWNEFQTLIEADVAVVWNPTTVVGENKTNYNVEVLKRESKFYKYVINRAAYRKDVKLYLVIMSEVS